jgi:squalene-hopene/tetraprenyl-beta-curcumene cyclase
LGFALAAVCCAVPRVATAATAATAGAAGAQELDLVGEIRKSVRWLRSVQDPLTGNYGGIEATALSVKALALSPDHYRAADGPFVGRAVEFLAAAQAEDGSIASEGAAGDERRRQTRLAVEALMLAPHRETVAALAAALAYLGEDGDDWDLRAAEAPENALAKAQQRLAQRKPEHCWDGPRGKVIETALAVIELSSCLPSKTQSAEPGPAPVELPLFDPADRKEAEVALSYGAKYLSSMADDRGRYGEPGHPHPGLTAMALAALATVPVPRPSEIQTTLDHGLWWLASLQHPDGSIHDGELANYTTAAAIMALQRGDPEEFSGVIEKAAAFLSRLQLDQEEGYSEGDIYYGGIGYGSTERPDLSNLQMALEALAVSGLEKGAPTYQKALRFLERTQNRSESNDVRIVDGNIVITSGDDGGAGYMPGDSKAGFVELADGTKVPRSYGSMTYALLKCYSLAGLPKDDPRLEAAWNWCREHYTLDVNPGFEHLSDPAASYQGLFYYFLTMAQALDAWGDDYVVTPDGERHHWRAELCGRVIAMRNKIDGSWVNRNSPRWYEGNPILATSYALLTLEAAMPKASH